MTCNHRIKVIYCSRAAELRQARDPFNTNFYATNWVKSVASSRVAVAVWKGPRRRNLKSTGLYEQQPVTKLAVTCVNCGTAAVVDRVLLAWLVTSWDHRLPPHRSAGTCRRLTSLQVTQGQRQEVHDQNNDRLIPSTVAVWGRRPPNKWTRYERHAIRSTVSHSHILVKYQVHNTWYLVCTFHLLHDRWIKTFSNAF